MGGFLPPAAPAVSAAPIFNASVRFAGGFQIGVPSDPRIVAADFTHLAVGRWFYQPSFFNVGISWMLGLPGLGAIPPPAVINGAANGGGPNCEFDIFVFQAGAFVPSDLGGAPILILFQGS